MIEPFGKLGATLDEETAQKAADIHAASFANCWSADEINQMANGFGGFLLVSTYAMAMGRVIAPEVELLTIAVLPDCRGRGFGSEILRSFNEIAVKNGAKGGFLEVDCNNSAAIHLYSQNNWHELSIRKDYYSYPDGSRSDALVMKINFVTCDNLKH